MSDVNTIMKATIRRIESDALIHKTEAEAAVAEIDHLTYLLMKQQVRLRENKEAAKWLLGVAEMMAATKERDDSRGTPPKDSSRGMTPEGY